MTYATRTDLEARYGEDELTQRESVLATGAVGRALDGADAEIDSYLSGRYSVPLSPVPPIIVEHACAIARYKLLGDAATERARNDYLDVRAWLRDVQVGRVLLAAATPLVGASPAATVEVTGGRKVFGGGMA